MEVQEAMSTRLITIRPDASIKQAAQKMVKHKISGLLVTTAGFELKGIITQGDILQAFAKGTNSDAPVTKVMTKRLLTIYTKDNLEAAAKKMVRHHIKRLPVVDRRKGKCVGIVTATDLMKYEEHLIERLSILFLTQQSNVGGG